MAIGVASIGPLYARAGSESILRDTLTNAAWSDSGLRVEQDSGGSPANLADLQSDVARRLPAGYGPGIDSTYATGIGQVQDRVNADMLSVEMINRDDTCAHIVMDSGTCTTGPGQIIAATRTAKQYGWDLGKTVQLSFKAAFVIPGEDGPSPINVKIVGLYHPKDPDENFWFGQFYFDPHLSSGDLPSVIDSVFTSAATFAGLGQGAQAHNAIDLPIVPSEIHLDDLPRLRAQTNAFNDGFTTQGDSVLTSIGKVLDDAGGESRLLRTDVLLVTLQLAVLTFLVLFLIVASAAEDRGAEVALAKLRGHRLGTVLQMALAEPLSLLVVSAPFGLIAGRLVVGGLSSGFLAPDTPVSIREPTILALLAALMGAVIAAGLGVSQIIRRPISAQWQRTHSAKTGTAAFAALEIVLGIGAVIAIARLHQAGVLGGHSTSNVALAVPLVIVLIAALIGSRLLPALARAQAPSSGGPRTIAKFLALRLVSRRAIGARLTVLLAVAVGLATSAVDISLVASGNRAQRAGTDVGAPIVLNVAGDNTLEGKVRAADPTGQWAMTTALWSSFGGTVQGYVLGADLKAFANVAHWRGDFASEPLSKLLPQLDAPPPAPIVIRDGELQVRASYSGDATPLQLQAVVQGSKSLSFNLGPMLRGVHTYTATVTGCSAGCDLTDLKLNKSEDQYVGTHDIFTLQTISTSGQQIAQSLITNAPSWTPIFGIQPTRDTEKVTQAGHNLQYEFTAPGADSAGLHRAKTPFPIPMALNPSQLLPGTTSIEDIDTTSAQVYSVAGISVLPEVKDAGNLIDLDYLTAALPHFGDYSTWQVWLGSKAPKDAVARLEKAGVEVQQTATIKARRDQLDRSGPSLGLLLFTFAAGAGALLAPAATAIAIFVTGRRRSFELAALMAVGVKRRTLFRACLGEQLMVLGTGAFVGMVAGFIGAQLALPNIPEFSDTPVPSLQLGPHLIGVLSFVAGMVLLVVATAALAARGLIRSADPAVLREAE